MSVGICPHLHRSDAQTLALSKARAGTRLAPHPVEMAAHALTIGLPAPRLPERRGSSGRGGTASAIVHLAVAALLVTVAGLRGPIAPTESRVAGVRVDPPRMVFLLVPGPGGGGGGGGNRDANPPSRAQAPGRDRVTVRVAPRVVAAAAAKESPPAPAPVALDVVPRAWGTTTVAGLPDDEAPLLPFSLGSGAGGGVGTGEGTGVGPGAGPGVGPGTGGGSGGGVYRPGGSVQPPTLLSQVPPRYTADAMQRHVRGSVTLEAIVGRDGVPRSLRVVRSLDPGGLDEEAVIAARQWRFAPGRIGTTPVDVLVHIILDFNVH